MAASSSWARQQFLSVTAQMAEAAAAQRVPVSEDWDDGGVLDEEITGPIDEADLQRFKESLN